VTSGLTPAELAQRVRANRNRCSERDALRFLEDWRARGVAEQDEAGLWRLTAKGRDMLRTYSLIEPEVDG
jgi:hypothetical protein